MHVQHCWDKGTVGLAMFHNDIVYDRIDLYFTRWVLSTIPEFIPSLVVTSAASFLGIPTEGIQFLLLGFGIWPCIVGVKSYLFCEFLSDQTAGLASR